MTKEDFLTDHRFIKWVNNPNPELDAYWKTWMDTHPQDLSELKLARELLLRVHYKPLKPREGAKQRVLHNVFSHSKPSPAFPPSKDQTGKYWWIRLNQFQRIAAILLVGLALTWLVFPHQTPLSQNHVAEAVPPIQKTTVAGEKLQFILPDGSKVWLNAVSTITFPAHFDALERRVFLSGEAYFEVEKDIVRPFRVVTGEVVTTALGTSFNINNKEKNNIEISLLTGKVSVSTGNNAEDSLLDPGQRLMYDPEAGEQQLSEFDPLEAVAWKNGQIIFRDASLEEVVKVLEDWYGVSIHLKNAKAVDWKYSGEYSNQSLKNVLGSLSYTQKFNYSIDDKTVEFKF